MRVFLDRNSPIYNSARTGALDCALLQINRSRGILCRSVAIRYLLHSQFPLVSQNSLRTAVFVTIVVAIGVIADGVTIAIFRSEASAFWLTLVFLNQASAYIFVGQIILADDDRIYLHGEL
jgi:hypothetical protein